MTGWLRRHLGALEPIDADAVSRRYAVGERQPGLPFPLWYREIRPDHELPDGVTAAALRGAFRQAVALRDRCSAGDRAELDSRTDWSLAVVTDQDTVVGVLLPGLSEDFAVPTGGGAGRAVLTLRHLCASDEAVAANGIDRSTVDDDLVRLALAAHLARTIQLLHRNRIAYSDLTLGRVAIAGRPPRTLLIGCDPTVALLAPARAAAQPTPEPGLDSGRLALCVIRALAKGPGATQLTDPAWVAALLGEPGVGLFTRALAPPPVQRPSAQQMYEYLAGRLAALARERTLFDPAASLPHFDVAAQLHGALPRLAVPSLPTVATPPAPAPLPPRPLVSADAHPPPRIELPVPVGLATTAPDAVPDAPAQFGSVVARAYVEANQQVAATVRDTVRTLREAIDERLPVARPRDPARPGRRHSQGSSS